MALLPNQTWIGILGGGQLGRMLAIEARRMGYEVVQWVGGPDSGPAVVSDWVIEEPFDCEKTLERFLDRVDVVTVEFENIPAPLLQAVEERCPLYPPALAIQISQNREKEKLFLQDKEIPCVPFAVVTDQDELERANSSIPGEHRVLKTAEFGYDGKGQLTFHKSDDLGEIWEKMAAPRAVLEQRIDLAAELSVLVARNPSGETSVYDPAENIHTNHILDLSIVPGRFSDPKLVAEARTIALDVCHQLNYVGILAVEFFLSNDGQLLVNEMAPRPHNSGHHTLDGCYTSQFEQQLRAVCDLPLGNSELREPTVMWNLLGDLWPQNGEPGWSLILGEPSAHLHLYGKREARPGRKMGHVNFTGKDLDELVKTANRIAEAMGWKR